MNNACCFRSQLELSALSLAADCNLGRSGRHSHQLSYPTRAKERPGGFGLYSSSSHSLLIQPHPSPATGPPTAKSSVLSFYPTRPLGGSNSWQPLHPPLLALLPPWPLAHRAVPPRLSGSPSRHGSPGHHGSSSSARCSQWLCRGPIPPSLLPH